MTTATIQIIVFVSIVVALVALASYMEIRQKVAEAEENNRLFKANASEPAEQQSPPLP